MKFGLIGYPLGHSMSPFIHKHLFEISSVDGEYKNIEIPPEHFDISALRESLDGFNVTIPHKTAVIPFLDEISGIAKTLQTVNTVKNDNGRLIGYNTDCDGFLKSLEIAGIPLKGSVIIYGCGGTARMMCYVAAQRGCAVTLCCRPGSENKAKALANEVAKVYNVNIKVLSALDGEKYDLLINASPAGMYPKYAEHNPPPYDDMSRFSAVFDAVYNPRRTKLIKAAEDCGIPVAYGMPMLVYQAAAAQTVWTGFKFSDSDLNELIKLTNDELERSFNQ